MMRLTSFASGLLFGVGLVVSGMANPAKVLGFINISENWDPSLAFVMGGAILVGVCGFAVARRRGTTVFGCPINMPQDRRIDARLLGGAALFGIGWGLAGICPGPGLVLIGMGLTKGLIFSLAMFAGMVAFKTVSNRRLGADYGVAAAPGRAEATPERDRIPL